MNYKMLTVVGKRSLHIEGGGGRILIGPAWYRGVCRNASCESRTIQSFLKECNLPMR